MTSSAAEELGLVARGMSALRWGGSLPSTTIQNTLLYRALHRLKTPAATGPGTDYFEIQSGSVSTVPFKAPSTNETASRGMGEGVWGRCVAE